MQEVSPSGKVSAGAKAPDPWRIMQPVRGQIRLAMAMAGSAVVCHLAAIGCLLICILQLLDQPMVWPWQMAAGAVVCTVLSYFLRLKAVDQSHFAAYRLETILRKRLSTHLSRVSMGYLQHAGATTLAKVIHDDVKALHLFVADSTPLYARAYVAPLLTLALMLWLDWRLGLAAIVVMLLGGGMMAMLLSNRGDLVKLYNDAREQVSVAVVEFVQAMPVVRTFDSGQSTFFRYQQALEAYLAVISRWYREVGVSARLSVTLLNPLLTLLVLFWVGNALYWQGSLGVAQWLGVLLIGTGMAESMMPIMGIAHMVDKAKLSIVRIEEVLAEPPLPEPAAPLALPKDASVEFELVDFSYGREHGTALHAVSFTVPAGSITALVGPSGAGKSTVAKLIPRFWDVQQGCVRIGGVDVRELGSDELMRYVAFVFQDTFLFAQSIAANIRMGKPQASMAEVIAAAQAARIHDFIQSLPQGYDTPVGERGVFLSGGQRQRLTIARAILLNRPILVLDEATAFADPENEAELVAALSVLMRGKTVIMIAHRLNTIRDADQILVFQQGRLAESGKHDDLLAACGLYGQLWHSSEQARRWELASARHAQKQTDAPGALHV